jgi:ribosomal protein S6--L-glutamate ligase/gamma-F420-2:alpha-L-glutamate ligase
MNKSIQTVQGLSNDFNLLVLPSIENIDEIIKGFEFQINLTKADYSELEFRFIDNNVQLLYRNVDIINFSYVWLSSFWGTRDLAYSVHLYLENTSVPHSYVEQATSKVTDQLKFAQNGITTPNTYYVGRHDITKYVEEIEEVCGYPLIIKDIKGSRGKYSAFCGNRIELLKTISEFPNHRKYMFQEYIPNEYDWGVLVANGVVVSAEKSYHSDGEFRNNVCNGSTEVFVDIKDVPEDIKNIAINSSNLLELKWSRSDIVIDKISGLPYLLEVNRFPGITSGTTEVKGAQTFLKSIYSLVNLV